MSIAETATDAGNMHNPSSAAGSGGSGLGRRSFLGYVIGGTTLVAAAELAAPARSEAVIPSLPQVPELYDLEVGPAEVLGRDVPRRGAAA